MPGVIRIVPFLRDSLDPLYPVETDICLVYSGTGSDQNSTSSCRGDVFKCHLTQRFPTIFLRHLLPACPDFADPNRGVDQFHILQYLDPSSGCVRAHSSMFGGGHCVILRFKIACES